MNVMKSATKIVNWLHLWISAHSFY